MIKRVLVVSMVGLSLVGCVNNDTLSGMFIPLLKRNKYRMSAMAPSLTYVRYRFRAVMILTLSVQLAVLFLVVSWEYCWWRNRAFSGYCSRRCCRWRSRSGRTECNEQNAGCRAGNCKDDGNTIMVVQKQGNTPFLSGPTCRTYQQWQSGDRFPALNKFACGQVTDHTPPSFHPLACNSMILCSSFAMSLISCSSSSAEMPCKISARVLLITASIFADQRLCLFRQFNTFSPTIAGTSLTRN